MSFYKEDQPLEAGIYPEFSNGERQRFGLRGGQIEYFGRVIKDAGWYNKDGQKLGFGDLSAFHLARIACEIDEEEAFIVMKRDLSFDAFIEKPGLTGGLTKHGAELEALSETREDSSLGELLGVKDEFAEVYPGLAYVALNGAIAISKDKLVFNSDQGSFIDAYLQGLDSIPQHIVNASDTLENVLANHGAEARDQLRPQLLPDYELPVYASELSASAVEAYEFAKHVILLSGAGQPPESGNNEK